MATATSFQISDTMRTAAQSVAMTHGHYLEHCRVMHKLKGKEEAMQHALKQRKDAHVAYHLALAYLKAATMNANPQIDLSGNISISWKERPKRQKQLNEQIDIALNQLIRGFETESQADEKTQHFIVRPTPKITWN